ncbi:hypothetical protein ACWCPT_05795 [Streptomyces sp. NPDC002308]
MMSPTDHHQGDTMHARTIAAAALLTATLVGCSSTTTPDAPATQPATSAPALSHAEQIEQCTAAVADIPAGPDGSVPSDPVPAECTALSDSEYLDAYYDGLAQSNKDGLQDLQDQIDEAATAG